jgi:peptidoglycan/xylan/chitin deacetylase (PgdA/CDA1 family)
MQVAPLVAEVLARQQVRATFFLANEPTRTGGTSLDEVWAPWWRALAEQGHAFASHTFDHVYWLSDTADGRFLMRPSAGPQPGKSFTWTGAQYCEELDRPAKRFEDMTGQKILPLFRAAGGKTSPALLRAAQACGYEHVGWAPAGFLGDELPSDQYPNTLLLERALRNIRSGDILVAHLGIWSRQDPWAPAVLEPLVAGLKKKGLCFATMDSHPAYREKIQARKSAIGAPDGAVVQPARETSPAAIDVLAPERQAVPPARNTKSHESND